MDSIYQNKQISSILGFLVNILPKPSKTFSVEKKHTEAPALGAEMQVLIMPSARVIVCPLASLPAFAAFTVSLGNLRRGPRKDNILNSSIKQYFIDDLQAAICQDN